MANALLADANEFYRDLPLAFVTGDARLRNCNGKGWHPIHHAVDSHIA